MNVVVCIQNLYSLPKKKKTEKHKHTLKTHTHTGICTVCDTHNRSLSLILFCVENSVTPSDKKMNASILKMLKIMLKSKQMNLIEKSNQYVLFTDFGSFSFSKIYIYFIDIFY